MEKRSGRSLAYCRLGRTAQCILCDNMFQYVRLGFWISDSRFG